MGLNIVNREGGPDAKLPLVLMKLHYFIISFFPFSVGIIAFISFFSIIIHQSSLNKNGGNLQKSFNQVSKCEL